ncbi:hypothetical protein EEL32_24805 [Brevibacillus laterosporus]|nr:hypothetical protein [Brevibacillus laterosporus]TPG74794.1 hypothetical protein EEL32_24805 [Brevibacillus laterosporus]
MKNIEKYIIFIISCGCQRKEGSEQRILIERGWHMLVWDNKCPEKEVKGEIKTGCSHMPNERLGTPHNKHLKNAPFKFIMPLRSKGKKFFY